VKGKKMIEKQYLDSMENLKVAERHLRETHDKFYEGEAIFTDLLEATDKTKEANKIYSENFRLWIDEYVYKKLSKHYD
jgi:hypothetical protein